MSDELFLCNAKPKDAQQAPFAKRSLRTRSNLPPRGSCPVRREGQAREFQMSPAANNGNK
ncbi:MAG: hypothetical protein DMG44_07290 [Acidobacteria bacterium]|nr:MAG: hypothetical protein DMG44_07290 [Acidobacteriota bacterium]